MNSSPRQRGINAEDLFNWLEQQPELAHLREQAASTMCEYRPSEALLADRIQLINADRELVQEASGPLQQLKNVVWVPGRKMRGTAFSTPDRWTPLRS